MLINVIRENLARSQSASRARRFEEAVHILDEFRAMLRAAPPSSDEVLQLLQEVIADPSMPEASDVFTAAWYSLSQDYVPPLCKILSGEHLAAWHEQTVELLGELQNPEAISVLVKSLTYHWDFDEWLCIPRKALHSLVAIGTEEALAVVQLAMQSDVPEIRNEAAELLESP